MVSLVTSLYKSDRYLSRFIERLEVFQKEMTARGLEFQSVIVSNDPTSAELKQFHKLEGKPWIKLIKVRRETLYASWNRGMRESGFNYLGFWNVDDNRYAEAIVEGLKLFNQEPGLIYFPFRYKRYLRFLGLSLLVKSELIMPPPFEKKEFGQSMHCGPFFLFNRSLYEKVGPFDENFKIAGDFEWCIRAAQETIFTRANTIAGEFINEGVSLSGGQYDVLDQETQRIYKKYNIIGKIKG